MSTRNNPPRRFQVHLGRDVWSLTYTGRAPASGSGAVRRAVVAALLFDALLVGAVVWDIAQEVSTGTLTAPSVLLFIALWGLVAWGQVQWWQRLLATYTHPHVNPAATEGSALQPRDQDSARRARAFRRDTLFTVVAGGLILLSAIVAILSEAHGGQIMVPTLLAFTLCTLVLVPFLVNGWRDLRRMMPVQHADESSRPTSGDDGE